jgi:hypothetical protein
MSQPRTTFLHWAEVNLPRGYELPAMTEPLVEALKDCPQDLIDAVQSGRKSLVYLQAFQTALLLRILAGGNDNALQGITWIRLLQLAQAIDLKAVDNKLEKVLAAPEKFFDPKKLRWGMKLSRVRGRPGRDELKLRLLLTPYRKLVEEEMERKAMTLIAAVKRKATEEGEGEEDRIRQISLYEEKEIRQRCLFQARNSVNRAWRELNVELPQATIALLIAVQFRISEDWQP